MKNSWTILCHRGIIEQDSNQISLISAIEKVTLRKAVLPEGTDVESMEDLLEKSDVALIPLKMQLVSYWTRSKRAEPETGLTRAQISGPNGKVLTALETEVDLTEHINRRTILKTDFFPFVGEGVYRVAAHMRPNSTARWRLCAESFVEAVVAKEAAVAGEAP